MLQCNKSQSTEVAQQADTLVPEAVQAAIMDGDLSKLTGPQRISYYMRVCESLGLNPLTKPFDFLRFQNKLILYARKDCADQLRMTHKLSVTLGQGVVVDGVYTIPAHIEFPSGRKDEDIGAVTIANLKGDALANAMMKAVTKAKRRATLSACGLGILDESEIDSMHGAVKEHFDPTRAAKEELKVEFIPAAAEEKPDLPPLPTEYLPAPEKNPWSWKLEGTKQLNPSYVGRALHTIPVERLRENLKDHPEKFSPRDKVNMQTALLHEQLRADAAHPEREELSFEEDSVPY